MSTEFRTQNITVPFWSHFLAQVPAIWPSLVTVLLNAFDRLALEYNIQGLDFTDPWKEINAKWHIRALSTIPIKQFLT